MSECRWNLSQIQQLCITRNYISLHNMKSQVLWLNSNQIVDSFNGYGIENKQSPSMAGFHIQSTAFPRGLSFIVEIDITVDSPLDTTEINNK